MTTLNLFTNRATAKLAADVSSADTALTLVPGGGDWFPAPAAGQFFRLVLQKGTSQTDQREYMVCTSREGDVLTVTRAQEGTPAANFTAGDEVSLVATALTMTSFVQRAGATLQGALEVEAPPTTPLGIATKSFVEAGRVNDVPDDGNTYGRIFGAWLALGAAAGLPLPIPVSAGGTGGVTVLEAQTNLYIPVTTFDDLPPATPKYGDRWIKPSNMVEMVWAPNAGGGGAGIWINPADATSQAYPITIDHGGTGATTAAQARINLGIEYTTQPFKLFDGTVAAPGLAWNSEPGLGWFRSAASVIGMAAQGQRTFAFDASSGTLTSLTMNPRAAGATAIYLQSGPSSAASANLQLSAGAVNGSIVMRDAAGAATTLPILYNAAQHTFTGPVVATSLALQTNWFVNQDANNVYTAMAPNWFWAWVKANGDLTWNRSGGPPATTFAANGDFYAGSNIFTGTAANFGLVGSVAGYRYLRFSSDDWRLQFNTTTGRMGFYDNVGNENFAVDGGGNGQFRGGLNVIAGLSVSGSISANGNIVAQGDLQAKGGAICIFQDSTVARYMSFGGRASAWSWQWDIATGRLSWLNSGSAALLGIDASGNAIFTGNVSAAGGQVSLQGNTLTVNTFGNSGGNLFSNVVQGSPGGMYQCMAFAHQPGVAAGISLQVGGGQFNFNSGGQAFKTAGAATWDGYSDIRLKENVKPYTAGLAEIIQLKPITYQFKDRSEYASEEPLVGLSAQDSEGVMPMMFSKTTDPRHPELEDVRVMHSDYLTYAMLNAIKTLHQRLYQLEKA